MGNMIKGDPMDPGGVLDKVIASTEGAEKSILYQLANFRKGGILVDCFNRGGSKEVERYVKENLGPLMYNHGKGEFITRTEYLRWKYRESERIDVGSRRRKRNKGPSINDVRKSFGNFSPLPLTQPISGIVYFGPLASAVVIYGWSPSSTTRCTCGATTRPAGRCSTAAPSGSPSCTSSSSATRSSTPG